MADAVDVATKQKGLGAATPLCDDCLRRTGASIAMEGIVGRPLKEEQVAYLWWKCPACDASLGPVTVPISFMLATEVRIDHLDRVPEAPSVFYVVDGESISFYVDPADSGKLIRMAAGPANGTGVKRARAAFDYLNGGNGSRVADPEQLD